MESGDSNDDKNKNKKKDEEEKVLTETNQEEMDPEDETTIKSPENKRHKKNEEGDDHTAGEVVPAITELDMTLSTNKWIIETIYEQLENECNQEIDFEQEENYFDDQYYGDNEEYYEEEEYDEETMERHPHDGMEQEEEEEEDEQSPLIPELYLLFDITEPITSSPNSSSFNPFLQAQAQNQEGEKQLSAQQPPQMKKQESEFKINEEQQIDLIEKEIKTLEDVVELGRLYEQEDFKTKNYSVNIKRFHELIPSIREFQALIGLDKLKQQIVEQILYLAQPLHNQFNVIKSVEEKEPKKKDDAETMILKMLLGVVPPQEKQQDEPKRLHKNQSCLDDDCNYDMLHTVIQGPPGTGKTCVAKLLARIYLSLGITKNDSFIVAKLGDLKGNYLGESVKKTLEIINKSKGGVLFIDEAYSLGSGGGNGGDEKRYDIYSKEIVDTINQQLTEERDKFILIIAGYKEELDRNFFALNPGLKSRFAFWYNIDPYTWEELTKILLFKIHRIGWKTHEACRDWLLKGFLRHKMDEFKYYARDIEMLLLNIKISHSSRIFGKDPKLQKWLTKSDIENGYNRYLEFKKQYFVDNNNPFNRPPPDGMYL